MLEYCTKALGICGLSLTSTISNLDQSIAKNIRIFPKDYLCCTSIVSKMLCFERQICLDMDKKAANLLETGQFDNSLRLRKVCLEKLRILQRKMIFASELEPMITKQMLILNVFSPTFAYGQNLINEKWTSEDITMVISGLFGSICLNRFSREHFNLTYWLQSFSANIEHQVLLLILNCLLSRDDSDLTSKLDISTLSNFERALFVLLSRVRGIRFDAQVDESKVPFQRLLQLSKKLLCRGLKNDFIIFALSETRALIVVDWAISKKNINSVLYIIVISNIIMAFVQE
jgi:hypothetical protein